MRKWREKEWRNEGRGERRRSLFGGVVVIGGCRVERMLESMEGVQAPLKKLRKKVKNS